LNDQLIRWVAGAVLSIGAAAPAFGGSVTRPGDTIGLPVGVPLPEGVWLGNNTTYEYRDTRPHTLTLVDTPIIVWSTPWTFLGARVQGSFGPVVPLKIEVGDAEISGLFNSFFAGQLIWDLGNDWGLSYMLGGYTDGNDPETYSSASLNQRFGASYTGNGWNLTANVIWGIQFDEVTDEPQISPCPVSDAYPHNGCNPDFLNVDMTATKRFGKWEVGPVGLYSTDLNKPVPDYQKQSQWALGGLVGYYFERVSVQTYITRNVHEKNYGGDNTSVNFRITIPLWSRPAVPVAQHSRPLARVKDVNEEGEQP